MCTPLLNSTMYTSLTLHTLNIIVYRPWEHHEIAQITNMKNIYTLHLYQQGNSLTCVAFLEPSQTYEGFLLKDSIAAPCLNPVNISFHGFWSTTKIYKIKSLTFDLQFKSFLTISSTIYKKYVGQIYKKVSPPPIFLSTFADNL